MKRYLLFKGSTYYPLGGFEDFYKSVDTLDEVDVAREELDWVEWVEVVDTDKWVYLSEKGIETPIEDKETE